MHTTHMHITHMRVTKFFVTALYSSVKQYYIVEGDFVSRTGQKRLVSFEGHGQQQHFHVSQHSIKILAVCPFSHAVQFFPCG